MTESYRCMYKHDAIARECHRVPSFTIWARGGPIVSCAWHLVQLLREKATNGPVMVTVDQDWNKS